MTLTFESACAELRRRKLLLMGDSLRPRLSEVTPQGYKVVFTRKLKKSETFYAYEVVPNGADYIIRNFSKLERAKQKFREESRNDRMESIRRLIHSYQQRWEKERKERGK